METWFFYFFMVILLVINISLFFICVRCLVDIEEIRIVVKGVGKDLRRFDKAKVKYTDGDNT